MHSGSRTFGERSASRGDAAIGGGAGSKEEGEKEDYLYFLFATPLAEHDIWLQAKEGFDDACEDFHVKGDRNRKRN